MNKNFLFSKFELDVESENIQVGKDKFNDTTKSYIEYFLTLAALSAARVDPSCSTSNCKLSVSRKFAWLIPAKSGAYHGTCIN